MSNNVLLLAMSVLPKEVRPNTYINFTEERVAAETNDGGNESAQIIVARGQMEPVAKMLISYFRENGQKLDKIIVLATKETLEAKKVLFIEDREGKEEKTEREICAVDFFKEQITGFIGEDAGQEEFFKIVHIDIDKQSQGIQHIIQYLRKLKAESGKIPLNLYVDTHGGLRSIQMTINALLFLLKNEAIYPQKIYTVVFRQGEEEQNQIRYERDFEIYDLVSGINEFINYGRSKSLCSYVAAIEGSEEENKAAVKLADIIQKISNAIQLCDMQRFEQALEELSEFVKSKPLPADSYLNLFVNSIKDDYGILLHKERSVSDILSWCIRKEFYQQALTLIESRMPKELMEHKIISVNDKAEAFVKKIKGIIQKKIIL